MATAYKDMNENDLQKKLAEKRDELREFRFDIAGTQARNGQEKRGMRKEIARMLTELNKRSA